MTNPYLSKLKPLIGQSLLPNLRTRDLPNLRTRDLPNLGHVTSFLRNLYGKIKLLNSTKFLLKLVNFDSLIL